MASYEVVFRKSVARDLRALPNRDIRRILDRIRALAENARPAGCEELAGRDLYRIRQGVYRIIYSIEDSKLIVLIVRIAHRRDIYRST